MLSGRAAVPGMLSDSDALPCDEDDGVSGGELLDGHDTGVDPFGGTAAQGSLSPLTAGKEVAPLRGGHIYYVSTPIGNLEDITLRAVRTLREADVIASEDTRVTAALLRHLGIGRKQLISHHEHNLARAVPKVLDALARDLSVALVSDAGTPGISDPGRELAAACAPASARSTRLDTSAPWPGVATTR